MKPSPKHGLTPSYRGEKHIGWVRRINGKPKWICGVGVAPTRDAADDYYTEHFAEFWVEPPAPPPTDARDMLIKDLANLFLNRKRQRIGQTMRGITKGTYDEYESALQDFCQHKPAKRAIVVGNLAYRGITPDDFGSYHASLGQRFGVDRQKKYVISVRSMFKMCAQPPARLPLPDYGDQFPLPSRADMRRARKKSKEKHGAKLFEVEEIRDQLNGRKRSAEEMKAEKERRKNGIRGLSKKIEHQIAGANVTMRAMILAAINAGFGNTDLAELPMSDAKRAIEKEWISYARGKTGADRLAWLWPETREAWKAYLAVRPSPAREKFANVFFLTSSGLPYVDDDKDQIALRYDALMARLRQNRDAEGNRTHRGRNFYSLRRTYRSIAAEIGKELLIDLTMGHADEGDDMSKLYTVAEMKPELKKIAEHVRSRVLSIE